MLEVSFADSESASQAFDHVAQFKDPAGQTYDHLSRVEQSSTGGGFDSDWTSSVFTVALHDATVYVFSYTASSTRAESGKVVAEGERQHGALLSALNHQLAASPKG